MARPTKRSRKSTKSRSPARRATKSKRKAPARKATRRNPTRRKSARRKTAKAAPRRRRRPAAAKRRPATKRRRSAARRPARAKRKRTTRRNPGFRMPGIRDAKQLAVDAVAGIGGYAVVNLLLYGLDKAGLSKVKAGMVEKDASSKMPLVLNTAVRIVGALLAAVVAGKLSRNPRIRTAVAVGGAISVGQHALEDFVLTSDKVPAPLREALSGYDGMDDIFGSPGAYSAGGASYGLNGYVTVPRPGVSGYLTVPQSPSSPYDGLNN